MKVRSLLSLLLSAAVGTLIVGCGGSMFRSTKTIHDPLALGGREGTVNIALDGDALTRQFSAETPRPPSEPSQALLYYSFGNNIDLAQYEGMAKLSLNQAVRLRFTFTPNSGMPGVIALRNASLRLWLRTGDRDSQDTPRSAQPVELVYTGDLTIERQTDGSYLTRESIPFSAQMDKASGSYLLNILASGSDNTLTADLSFTAETSSTNVAPNATARLSIEFQAGSAYIQW